MEGDVIASANEVSTAVQRVLSGVLEAIRQAPILKEEQGELRRIAVTTMVQQVRQYTPQVGETSWGDGCRFEVSSTVASLTLEADKAAGVGACACVEHQAAESGAAVTERHQQAVLSTRGRLEDNVALLPCQAVLPTREPVPAQATAEGFGSNGTEWADAGDPDEVEETGGSKGSCSNSSETPGGGDHCSHGSEISGGVAHCDSSSGPGAASESSETNSASAVLDCWMGLHDHTLYGDTDGDTIVILGQVRKVVQLAKSLKLDGNRWFALGDVQSASLQYFEAINLFDVLDRSVLDCFAVALLLILLTNIALCFLKLGDNTGNYECFEAAREATNHALVSDPTNIKARYRRGCAHTKLGELGLARADFDWILGVEPTSDVAKQGLRGLQEHAPHQAATATTAAATYQEAVVTAAVTNRHQGVEAVSTPAARHPRAELTAAVAVEHQHSEDADGTSTPAVSHTDEFNDLCSSGEASQLTCIQAVQQPSGLMSRRSDYKWADVLDLDEDEGRGGCSGSCNSTCESSGAGDCCIDSSDDGSIIQRSDKILVGLEYSVATQGSHVPHGYGHDYESEQNDQFASGCLVEAKAKASDCVAEAGFLQADCRRNSKQKRKLQAV